MFIVYVMIVQYFATRWKCVDGPIKSYTLNGDLRMMAQDNVTFERKLTRDSIKSNLNTDTEKCEWALEKMREMFQFFNTADVSLWPYQLVLSFIGSSIICYQIDSKLDIRRIIGISFIVFVLIDLPRRFLSFHKNALVTNKALNIYTFYYKNMKGKNIDEKELYL